MREKCTLRPNMATKYASETNLVLNKSTKISKSMKKVLQDPTCQSNVCKT